MRGFIRTLFIAFLLLMMLMLASCLHQPDLQSRLDDYLATILDTEESQDAAEPHGTGTEKPDESPRYTVTFAEDEQFENELKRKAAEHIDPFIRQAVEQMNSLKIPQHEIKEYTPPTPQRDSLRDPVSVEIYDTILRQVSDFEDYCFDERDYDHKNFFSAFAAASDALKVDHRELFLYCDMLSEGHIYQSGYYMPGMWLNDLCEDREAVKNEVLYFRAIADRILEKMPADLNRNEQCAYFIAVIACTTEYDDALSSLENSFQEYDVLVKSRAVCQGYARTFAYLCQKAGIACHYCSGTTDSGGAHAWNYIDTSDGLIYVDITWYDSSENEEYLFMTQKQFEAIGYVQKNVE